MLNDENTTPNEKVILKNELSALDFEQLRNEIHEKVNSICFISYYEYREEYQRRAFKTANFLTPKILMDYFNNMSETLKKNIFENTISASMIFEDLVYEQFDYKVDRKNYEDFLNLYLKIKNEHSDYLKPFLQFCCNMINNNYEDVNNLPF